MRQHPPALIVEKELSAMIFIIYKTTNLVNGKFYIGKHNQSTDSFDGYYGSGSLLKKAIKKYGKDNFIRETLFEFSDEYSAYQKEVLVISENLSNPLCYNLRTGGTGRSYNSTEQSRYLQSKSALARWEDPEQYNAMVLERQTRYNNDTGKEIIDNIANSVKALWEDPEYVKKQTDVRSSMEYRSVLREKAKNREKFQCIHCSGMFQPSHLVRWHNDNCKLNPALQ